MRLPPTGAGQLHLMQASALVLTARRAAGRAMSRLPMDPTGTRQACAWSSSASAVSRLIRSGPPI